MPTKVNIPPIVLKEIKHLKRKYPTVVSEVRKLVQQLEADERPGDKVPGVGFDVYKVRLPNPSANRGKSGGFRAIYYVQLANNVIMVTIYSKTEQTNITPEEIHRILEDLPPSAKDDET